MPRRWLALISFAALVASAPAQTVDFNRDVRPILSGKCFQCHGPDDAARKAGLRLDVRDLALKELKSGQRAVVAGDAAKSEMASRISAKDDSAMPPAKLNKRLSEKEVATLRKWIDEGAKYAQHWSYAKPARPTIPAGASLAARQWIRNPIDAFIIVRLEKDGLTPAAPADRYAIIRRLSIDLTGVPPTIEETDRFVNDKSADAYDKLVDRLLASRAYGERWAQVWLDLARYADSQGYANDPDRTIWRWRDWLIEALNQNKPFDQFTIEILAGDLLPNPSPEQLIATGFHRNTLTNTEGGTNPEEFRSAAIVDRVNTTMAVWMGTTIACCQCHNHKYDPISQKEYYQLYAILNNCQDANGGDDAPTLRAGVVGREKEFAEISAKLAELHKHFDGPNSKIDAEVGQAVAALTNLVPAKALKIINKDGKLKDRIVAAERAKTPLAKLDAEIKALDAKLAAVSTTTPILREGPPRATNIHLRGDFQNKGDAVQPGFPSAFPSLPQDGGGKPRRSPNRLDLAKWLVSPENPLTARVAVNRLWEELFGVGIVETSEEFGMQGDQPSHPELLDWLATEYIRLGWDTKALLKLIVTSSAYRQSSQVSDAARAKDPFNRLISRGPRVRLSAEEIRDQALFAGGLLSLKMYGPPVQPPKPNFGLSAAFGGTTDWQPSPGEDKYRRGLYTRIRRNAPYPAMTTFDAPERTSCNIRRLRTNTPLQALVTLNDPVYVEAAQALARRLAAQSGDVKARATFAFRLVLTRPPSEKETSRLVDLFDQVRGDFAKDPAKAAAMATKPLGPAPKGADVTDLAAWSVVSNVLLNLDEALAKP
jgi:mono/diheme cytochrome c family protein